MIVGSTAEAHPVTSVKRSMACTLAAREVSLGRRKKRRHAGCIPAEGGTEFLCPRAFRDSRCGKALRNRTGKEKDGCSASKRRGAARSNDRRARPARPDS